MCNSKKKLLNENNKNLIELCVIVKGLNKTNLEICEPNKIVDKLKLNFTVPFVHLFSPMYDVLDNLDLPSEHFNDNIILLQIQILFALYHTILYSARHNLNNLVHYGVLLNTSIVKQFKNRLYFSCFSFHKTDWWNNINRSGSFNFRSNIKLRFFETFKKKSVFSVATTIVVWYKS